MPRKETQDEPRREPTGFTPHKGGLASEYAREQGWGINEDERTRTAQEKQDADGGRDYDYGPRDFGDSAVDTSSAQPPSDSTQRTGPNQSSTGQSSKHEGSTRGKPLRTPPRKTR